MGTLNNGERLLLYLLCGEWILSACLWYTHSEFVTLTFLSGQVEDVKASRVVSVLCSFGPGFKNRPLDAGQDCGHVTLLELWTWGTGLVISPKDYKSSPCFYQITLAGQLRRAVGGGKQIWFQSLRTRRFTFSILVLLPWFKKCNFWGKTHRNKPIAWFWFFFSLLKLFSMSTPIGRLLLMNEILLGFLISPILNGPQVTDTHSCCLLMVIGSLFFSVEDLWLTIFTGERWFIDFHFIWEVPGVFPRDPPTDFPAQFTSVTSGHKGNDKPKEEPIITPILASHSVYTQWIVWYLIPTCIVFSLHFIFTLLYLFGHFIKRDTHAPVQLSKVGV